MKPLMFGLCCLLAQGAFAEHPGGAIGGGHAGGLAAGHNAGRAHASIRAYGYGRRGAYGYGGYYDPFYDSGYYRSADPDGSNPLVYPASAPSVTLAQTVHPVIHEYTQPEDYGVSPERESGPILYLIAFRDNTIRAAMTYWVEDGALHYLDKDHQQKQAPLSTIDRDLSAQLNRERHVPFNIP
jgi:hypothetical protein